MAKVIRLHQFGTHENLKIDNLEVPNPQKGQVKIKVKAAALSIDNFMFINGSQFSEHRFVTPPLPSRIGYEGAGTVIEVGEGVNTDWLGQNVVTLVGFDESKFGILGEEAILPIEYIQKYPLNLSATEAASYPVPFLTAYALKHLNFIKKGDYVSIPAATSSVGLAAMQIVKNLEGKTIAITRNKRKRQLLLDNGADFVITTDTEDYLEQSMVATQGKGINVTFDPIGGVFLEQAAKASAAGGYIIEYGIMGGLQASYPVSESIGKGLTIRGFTVGEITTNSKSIEEAMTYINEHIQKNEFKPRVDKVFRMCDVIKAYDYLKEGNYFGKTVVSFES